MLEKSTFVPAPKALPFLAMIYVIIIVSSTTLVYKIVSFGFVTITAGALLSPAWYSLGDVIAEIYGYQLSRRIIWFGLICEGLFVFLCSNLIKLPSPDYWHHQAAYNSVLGALPRIYLGSIVGTIVGAFSNTYLLSKWKILLKGNHFWLRAVGSNAVGQLIFSCLTAFIDLLGVVPITDIFKIIFASYSIKVILVPILAIPAAVLVIYLKKYEGFDVYDTNTNFNPFKF